MIVSSDVVIDSARVRKSFIHLYLIASTMLTMTNPIPTSSLNAGLAILHCFQPFFPHISLSPSISSSLSSTSCCSKSMASLFRGDPPLNLGARIPMLPTEERARVRACVCVCACALLPKRRRAGGGGDHCVRPSLKAPGLPAHRH